MRELFIGVLIAFWLILLSITVASVMDNYSVRPQCNHVSNITRYGTAPR